MKKHVNIIGGTYSRLGAVAWVWGYWDGYRFNAEREIVSILVV